MEKKKVLVKHLVVSSEDGDWPPVNAALFMKWLSDRLSEIPDECRDSARIEIDSSADEDCSVTYLRVTYLRDESDDEIGRRKSVERMVEERDRYSAEHLERVERQVLAELKKKYER